MQATNPFEGMTTKQLQNMKCKVCGCTSNNCAQCIAKTGKPCHWIAPNLCSACKDESLIIQSNKSIKMKFTTETSTLKEALQRLGFAVNAKSVIPVISSVLATVTKGKVLLTTTDLMVTINHGIDCETDGEGCFLIPYHHLKNIVALETGNVSIEWNAKTGAIAKFDQDVFKLGKNSDVADFPKYPEVPKHMVAMNTEFLTAIKMAALGVSKDEYRPVMHNVCVEMESSSVTITSTDGFTIYTHQIAVDHKVEGRTELLVPSVVAKALDGCGDFKIGFNKNHMAFEAGQVFIMAKRAEGNFPQWRAAMPKHESNVTVKIGELRSAVEKAYVMSDVSNNSIDFMIKEDEVELRTEVKDTGMSSSCKVPAKSEATVEHMKFSGRFLKRIITQLESQTETDGDICFSIQNDKKATVQAFGKENVTVLVVGIAGN